MDAAGEDVAAHIAFAMMVVIGAALVSVLIMSVVDAISRWRRRRRYRRRRRRWNQ